MSSNCLYCLSQLEQTPVCVSQCLVNNSIQPQFPAAVLFGSLFIALILFVLAVKFRGNLKQFIGMRILSIGFFVAAIFTIGLVFNGHAILREIPLAIFGVGLVSYAVPYFFSLSLVRSNYKSVPFLCPSTSKFVQDMGKKFGLNSLKLFLFFSKEPKAFSVDGFRKAVFLSDSLIQKLDQKEVEAVILHELQHLKRKSGLLKNFIASIRNLSLKVIPAPIAELEKYEEAEIDKILEEKFGVNTNAIREKLWGSWH